MVSKRKGILNISRRIQAEKRCEIYITHLHTRMCSVAHSYTMNVYHYSQLNIQFFACNYQKIFTSN